MEVTLAVGRILETALYCADPRRVARFYRDVLGIRVMDESERLIALDAGAGTVLLIFRRGTTTPGATTPGGSIPPHDGTGPVHLAFTIQQADLSRWEERLAQAGVAIESRVTWKRGGTSLYFRDPEGHSVELATPGLWEVY